VKLSEVRQLAQVKAPMTSRRRRVLANAYNVMEYRAAARRALPRGIFDYLDGGSEDEVSLRHNRAAFDRWGLMPGWGPVTGPDTSTTLLGRTSALPLTLSPTGATRLFHPEGELAVAKAAHAAGVPYGLAGLSTVPMESLADRFPDLDRWFSFGLTSDRGYLKAKLDRCTASGYRALLVNVDTRALGSRERDRRNGFTAPPTLTLSSLIGIAARPRWWVRFLRAEGIRFPNLEPGGSGDPMVSPSMWQQILEHSDASRGWDDLETLRASWPGRIILKGCINPDDIVRAADIGLDAVQLSNHGGRQLDHMLSPMDVLQESRQRVGDRIELYVDSGIRRGGDIFKALALGADACSIGRPYLYGLAAAGSPGVSRVIDILADELRRTMTLVGVSSITELKERGSQVLREIGTRRPADGYAGIPAGDQPDVLSGGHPRVLTPFR
jgi:L-lactate dehydrogenase (cytochrome)